MDGLRTLLGGVLLLGVHASSQAECPALATVSAEFTRASAVFSGRVVQADFVDVGPEAKEDGRGAKVLVVRINVERWWKGDGAGSVNMRTSVTKLPNGTMKSHAEDFRFTAGETYLVYAFGARADLRTSACGRTRRLSDARDDLRELGAGSTPVEGGHSECAIQLARVAQLAHAADFGPPRRLEWPHALRVAGRSR